MGAPQSHCLSSRFGQAFITGTSSIRLVTTNGVQIVFILITCRILALYFTVVKVIAAMIVYEDVILPSPVEYCALDIIR